MRGLFSFVASVLVARGLLRGHGRCGWQHSAPASYCSSASQLTPRSRRLQPVHRSRASAPLRSHRKQQSSHGGRQQHGRLRRPQLEPPVHERGPRSLLVARLGLAAAAAPAAAEGASTAVLGVCSARCPRPLPRWRGSRATRVRRRAGSRLGSRPLLRGPLWLPTSAGPRSAAAAGLRHAHARCGMWSAAAHRSCKRSSRYCVPPRSGSACATGGTGCSCSARGLARRPP